jgi:hypothetical protein
MQANCPPQVAACDKPLPWPDKCACPLDPYHLGILPPPAVIRPAVCHPLAAASDRGEVVDGLRSAATGQHADHVAAVLAAGGVRCQVLGTQAYRAQLVEKLLWASVFWLMSSALGGKQVRSHHAGAHCHSW